MPAVVVCDHGHGGVANFRLPGQLGFLQVGHSDDIGAPAAIEVRFGPGGKLRAFHTNIDAASFHHDACCLGALLDRGGYSRTNRVAKRHVGYDSLSKKCRGTLGGAVDELIRNYKFGGLVLQLERADGGDGDDSFDAQLLHGKNVGAEVKLRGEQAMSAGVTREKGYFSAFQVAESKRVRRIAKRSGDFDFTSVGEAGHGIKPATSDDSNFRLLQTGSAQ